MNSPDEPGNDAGSDGAQPDGPDDTLHTADSHRPGPRLSPALIATLVAVPVMVIAGFIAYVALQPTDTTTPVDAYAAAESGANGDCAKLFAALPTTFEGFGSKLISGDTARWSGSDGGDPVTVRCGVGRPAEFAPSSRLQAVNGVQWFITDTIDGRGQAYVCVDHRPYVALWVPVSAGNASITDVSAAIGRVLPSGPLDFG